MAKRINFVFEGNEYTLEYTRNTIKMMESRGVVVSDIQNKPMTVLPQLFEGAFLCHHRNVKAETIQRIYDRMTNKQELIEKLSAMYSEPIQALFDEPEENEGNVLWEASW